MLNLLLLLLALPLEVAIGYPTALFTAIGHPVTWIGSLLASLERRANRGTPKARRFAGTVTLIGTLGAAGLPAYLAQASLSHLGHVAGVLLTAMLASTLLAQRSLFTHVAAVAAAIEREGLASARLAVARIVGRDTEVLDEAGVARAAIESLAENFSDGVVAPALWCAIGGLPGIALYKAANTADSMIGHRSARYREFGWAAARIDDLVNLPAARLAALWLVLAGAASRDASARGAIAAVRRDARRHRSPNAGWPEAAMAGALGLRLAGPRVYGGQLIEDAYMGDGRAAACAADIRRALRLYCVACALQFLAVATIFAVCQRPVW